MNLFKIENYNTKIILTIFGIKITYKKNISSETELKKFPEKIYIQEFNKKWAGKEAWFCDWFTKWIVFSYEDVTFCCEGREISSLKPPNIEPITLKNYLERLDMVLNDMQLENNPCIGCKQLVKKIIPEYKLYGQIESFSISHYTKCHIRCAYCFIPLKNLGYKDDMKYNAVETINFFRNMNMVSDNAAIGWGGGEPTISKYFDKNIEAIKKMGYKQFINTTAVLFSETIMKGLQEGNISIQISVDSGSPQTYKKVKGVDKYEIVWTNIKKYCQFSNMVRVKYILFEWNANKIDINGFIEKCVWAGVKNVTVSPEMTAENCFPSNPTNWNMNNKKVTDMAALIKYLCKKNGLNLEPYIGVYWTKQHLEDIDIEFKRLNNYKE